MRFVMLTVVEAVLAHAKSGVGNGRFDLVRFGQADAPYVDDAAVHQHVDFFNSRNFGHFSHDAPRPLEVPHAHDSVRIGPSKWLFAT